MDSLHALEQLLSQPMIKITEEISVNPLLTMFVSHTIEVFLNYSSELPNSYEKSLMTTTHITLSFYYSKLNQ